MTAQKGRPLTLTQAMPSAHPTVPSGSIGTASDGPDTGWATPALGKGLNPTVGWLEHPPDHRPPFSLCALSAYSTLG